MLQLKDGMLCYSSKKEPQIVFIRNYLVHYTWSDDSTTLYRAHGDPKDTLYSPLSRSIAHG